MKRKLTSLLLVLAIMTGTASAAIQPRYSYISGVFTGISMQGSGIKWNGGLSTYSMAAVTSVKVTVKLQVSTFAGWGTIETKTGTGKYSAEAGSTYYDWISGESYRISTEVWVYNGSTLIENVGPYYDYLNT